MVANNQHPYSQGGSVSTGTLRTEDLLRAFADAAWDIYQHNNEAFPFFDPEEYPGFRDWYNGHGYEDYPITIDAEYLLEDLQDALNDLAPEGFYFGAHPGDGADFGFWPIDDDSAGPEDEEECTPCEDDIYAYDYAGPFYSGVPAFPRAEKPIARNRAELSDYMEREHYWPNVWIIYDDGEPHLYADWRNDITEE